MTRRAGPLAFLIGLVTLTASGCALTRPNAARLDDSGYGALVARATVWRPTRVRSMNLREGPTGRDAFKPGALIRCKYVPKELSGQSPKFACVLPSGDELKVKYGRDNGEIYAEVAATRLLWALGFGADGMYPVRVECEGCPPPDKDAGAVTIRPNLIRFDYATVERKMDGVELEGPDGEGWAWEDLDTVGPLAARDAATHRDALKLLAVILQHADSKRQQQRLVCLGGSKDDPARKCDKPFMMINDLGKTFGKATLFNVDDPGSVNLEAWSGRKVWKDDTGCFGNLPASFTGTIHNPVIREAGRKFLAGLLGQLSDKQLSDLFDVARFPSVGTGTERTADVRAWVTAFKDKVVQVTERSCFGARGTS
jgi:hypothetical protein